MKILFDIGGTHIRISSVSEEGIGEVVRLDTPSDLISAKKLIIESINKISNGNKIESIVGGVPGIVKDGVILNAPNLKDWHGFDIGSFLKENFCESVFIYNDASLAGLGESHYGAGKGYDIVAYIGIGTGVGGARIVTGNIDENSVGFEPGHHILDVVNGKTFEDLVSGRGIFEQFGLHAEQMGQDKLKELVPILAEGLYNTIQFWSPDVLVLGGSLFNENTAYKIEDVREALNNLKNDTDEIFPEIEKAELGDNSGLYGALGVTKQLN